jgi:hypothetical protein
MNKCPKHPDKSGESQYGGLWCRGPDGGKCSWAHREFVNEGEDGELTKVLKWRLPEGGKWLAKEAYIEAIGEVEAVSAPSGDGSDRNQSIVRQSSIKAAAWYLAGGEHLNAEDAGAKITNLAGILEDWVNR